VVNAIEIPRTLLVNNQSVYIVEENQLRLLPVDIVYSKTSTVIIKGINDGVKMLSKPFPGAFEGMNVTIIK
jgi:hypothetical protein